MSHAFVKNDTRPIFPNSLPYSAYEIHELGFNENARSRKPSAQERLTGKQPPRRAWTSSDADDSHSEDPESD